MPIHADQRARYPEDWKSISFRIRVGRAGGRCECDGRCGVEHAARCDRMHGAVIPGNKNGSKVVLTTAHLDHRPGNVNDDNLLAMCQRCHLAYDREHHKAERERRRTTT